ncbi:unnamed protein product [Rotaria sp. Silwood2]|nr:unnamed protein product [Rotaria sp. Silwood2]CAF4415219.1 unnamed protein product [Rotaria sp. Silwood2]
MNEITIGWKKTSSGKHQYASNVQHFQQHPKQKLKITAISVGIVFGTIKSQRSASGTVTENTNQNSLSTISTTIIASSVSIGSQTGAPCLSYTTINDPSRNVAQTGLYGSCDIGPLFNAGNNGSWIRFVGTGGTIISLAPPGITHCGGFFTRVLVYHHVFRARGPPRTTDQYDQSHRNPAFDPHVDSDPAGIRKKMKEMLGEEEAEKAMQTRYQAINVWRLLGPNAITDKPLAICDYRSIDVESDVHLIELRGSVNTSAAYTISRSTQDAHVWYYLSQMRSNEMFIFKTFDSKSDVAQFAFHTAFINENMSPLNVEQKSIELRCFIFYDQ